MRVDLHAKVITRDGEEVGNISRAVFDPKSEDITGFVVSTGGLFGRDVLVPRDEINRSTQAGNDIHLEITKDRFDEMAPFDPVGYAAPPIGWVPPIAMEYPGSAYLWPAAAAPEAYEDTSPQAGRQDTITVSRGDTVQDRDGDDIGVVEDVRLDPETGELLGVVIREGNALQSLFGGGSTEEVPAEVIGSVNQNVIRLSIDKDDMKRAA